MKQTYDLEDEVQVAFKYYQQGNYEVAERLCQNLLVNDPQNPHCYFILAHSLYKRQRIYQAIQYFKKCIACNNSYENAYCSLAAIYSEQNNVEEAIKLLEKGIKKNKTSILMMMEIGQYYQNAKKYIFAIKTYHQILLLDRNCFAAYNNVGNCYRALKQLDYALTAFKKAKMINNDSEILNNNIGAVFFEQGEFSKLIKFYDDLIANNPLNSYFYNRHIAHKMYYDVNKWQKFANQNDKIDNLAIPTKAELLISETICNWLHNDIPKCQESLNKFAQLNITSLINLTKGDTKNLEANLAFYKYLNSLITTSDQVIDKQSFFSIHVIGDSHSLTSANRIIKFNNTHYQVTSHLIWGCKMWHLAQEGINAYKKCFIKRLKELPKNSLVVISLGEIDCRITEGIFTYAKKLKVKYEVVIKQTITQYINFLLAAEAKQYQFIIAGIPAPNNILLLNTLNLEEQKAYLEMVKLFNKKLKELSIKNNFAFIDYYTMTANNELISNGKFHLEEVHLIPSSLEEGITNYLTTPLQANQ